MNQLLRHWGVGPARPTTWRRGFPMPGHRTLSEVSKQEEELREHRAALFPTRSGKVTQDVGRPNNYVGENDERD